MDLFSTRFYAYEAFILMLPLFFLSFEPLISSPTIL
jgi:hypothetical protein